MLKLNGLVFLLVIFLSIDNAISQERSPFYKDRISLHTFKGFILPHYEFIYANVNSTISSIDLNYSTRLVGDSIWDKIYNKPGLGIKVLFTTLGNDEIFGRGYSLVPNFTFNLFSKKRVSCFSTIGLGLGYVTKKFDSKDNIKNIAIGSHFNIHFDYKLGVSYYMTEKVRISGGLFFGHYSNANTSINNLGLNFASSFIGMEYMLNQSEHNIGDKKRNLLPKEGNFFTYGGLGIRNSDFFTTPLNFSFLFQRNVSDKYLLGGGIDLFYDPIIEKIYKEFQISPKPSDNFSAGIFIKQAMRYRNFYFSLIQGIYIIENKIHGLSYFKPSFEYNFYKNYFAKVSVKTHLFNADYPEIAIGYKW